MAFNMDELDRVTFKDEDEVNLVPVGPVWFVDKNGNHRPYKTRVLDGQTVTDWLFLTDAAALAQEYDLPLERI